jgi:putative membrane protein
MKKQILTHQELKRLADVIGEVEEKTIGEIRLMIVGRSAVTGHVHNTVWVLLLAVSFLLIWFERHDLIYFERWWLWPALIVGLYLFANILSRFQFIQRAFTSNHDLHHQVMARAEVEFHREGLNGTLAHTGVLIFLSLMERYAVVLADKGIADKLPVHAWDKVVSKVIAGARSGHWADKLEEAIRECGTYLASHFPPQGLKSNELPNTVIIKD